MLECGRRCWGRGVAGRGGTVVPEGGRHATIPARAVVEAAVRAFSVVCGAGGDRDLARATARRARDRPPARARAVPHPARAAPPPAAGGWRTRPRPPQGPPTPPPAAPNQPNRGAT